MNLFKLTIANLRQDLFSSLMNLVLLSLGVATIIIMLLAGREVQDGFFRNAKGIDLVVGAKGSPLQIILSSVYQMDVPTGNIPLETLNALKANPNIKNAVPVSMGDNYEGFRIVGTDESYLKLYNLELASGAIWKEVLEATIGAEVAKRTGLKVGDVFAGAHGLSGMSDIHKHTHYKITGILKPSGTIADRLVLTSIESPWRVHEYHDPEDTDEDDEAPKVSADGVVHHEVTAALIQYRSPVVAISLPKQINATSNEQAAVPSFEISRLLSLLGVGINTLKAFGLVFLVVSTIGVFAALYKSLRERRFELAVMRVQGASKRKVFLLILCEGLLLGIAGAVVGVIVGHISALFLAQLIGNTLTGAGATFLPEELFVLGGVILLATLAALIPAVMAYKTNISEVLTNEG